MKPRTTDPERQAQVDRLVGEVNSAIREHVQPVLMRAQRDGADGTVLVATVNIVVLHMLACTACAATNRGEEREFFNSLLDAVAEIGRTTNWPALRARWEAQTWRH